MRKTRLLGLTTLLITLAFIFSQSSVFANWTLTSEGKLIYEPEGQVLGTKDNPGKGDENRSDKAQSNKSNATAADSDQESSDDTDDNSPGNSQKSEKSNQGKGNQKTATDSGDINTVRIKTTGNDKVKVKFVNKHGDTIDVPAGTESGEFVIEPPDYQQNVKVKTQKHAAYVIRNKIAAQTNFPLTVNLETNELIVTTPKGSKVVTVLPDKAVENMLAANVLDQLGGKGGLRWLQQQATPSATPIATDSGEIDDQDDEPDDATDSGDMEEPTPTPSTDTQEPDDATESAAPEVEEEVDTVVTLTTDEEGTLVYEIKGVKYKKFFGIRKVELQRVAVVSAETGELIRLDQDFLTRLLDLLSTS